MDTRKPARYEEIAADLRGLIAVASPGGRLPSDAELCGRYGVSRMTARQAVQVVASDGLIDRRRGAGTFVRSSLCFASWAHPCRSPSRCEDGA